MQFRKRWGGSFQLIPAPNSPGRSAVDSDVGGQQQWAPTRSAPQMIANRAGLRPWSGTQPPVYARVAFFPITYRRAKRATPRTRPVAFRRLGTFRFDEGRQHCLRYWRDLGNDTCQYLSRLLTADTHRPGHLAHVHAVDIPACILYIKAK